MQEPEVKGKAVLLDTLSPIPLPSKRRCFLLRRLAKMTRNHTEHVSSLSARSPEAAPSYVMLAEVFQIRRLAQQPLHLLVDMQLRLLLEIPSCQLLLDTAQYL